MSAVADPLTLVNALLGSAARGNCLVGPYCPFGLARPGPDTFYPQPTHGYRPGDPIQRFSQTHVAGTGGASRYGNFALSPFTGPPRENAHTPFLALPVRRVADAIPQDEEASVGHYAVTHQPWNIRVELTCSPRVAVHRYQFPQGREASVLFDVGAVINNGLSPTGEHRAAEEWDPEGHSIGGWIEHLDAYTLQGRGDFRGGWGHDKPYSLFFYLRFDQPMTSTRFAHAHGLVPSGEGAVVAGPGCRTVAGFGPIAELNVQIGLSYVSCAQARASVERETAGKSFADIVQACRDLWAPILDRFHLEGGTSDDQQLFFSFLYRLYCLPTDLGTDDEHPFWHSGVRSFTDFYCLWDSVRNANSFFHLFDPATSRDFLNSLLDTAEHTGWLPDAHIVGRHAYMQSACAADVLFGEAALKGVSGVDYRQALKWTTHNNEAVSPDLTIKGRWLDDYHRLGYLSTDVPKVSVSRHLEYTCYDWCIAQLAAFLGEDDVARQFLEQSERVWSLWRDDLKAFAPRHPDGTWAEPFDPWVHPPESWNDPVCYEGNAAVWSMNVFQDFPELIARHGGPAAFIARLDELFDRGAFAVKETRMHIPHLYTWAGRPDLASRRVRESIRKSIHNRPDGIPGNEDMGCQSAYFLCNAMGVYPVMGQPLYVLCAPLFDRLEARLGDDVLARHLRISAKRTGDGLCIHEATLNGEPLDRAWLTHDEIAHGAALHFVLGDTPSQWGQHQPPPGGMDLARQWGLGTG